MTSTVRGSKVSVMPQEHLGAFVPLELRITANQNKVVLSDTSYPVLPNYPAMNHFCSSGSGLFQDDYTSIHGAREMSQKDLLSMEIV